MREWWHKALRAAGKVFDFWYLYSSLFFMGFVEFKGFIQDLKLTTGALLRISGVAVAEVVFVGGVLLLALRWLTRRLPFLNRSVYGLAALLWKKQRETMRGVEQFIAWKRRRRKERFAVALLAPVIVVAVNHDAFKENPSLDLLLVRLVMVPVLLAMLTLSLNRVLGVLLVELWLGFIAHHYGMDDAMVETVLFGLGVSAWYLWLLTHDNSPPRPEPSTE